MRRLALQTALAGLLLAPAPVLAQGAAPLSGLYAGIFGGAGLLGEQDVNTDVLLAGIPFDSDSNIDYDPGIRFGGFVGYQLDTNIRVQVDLSYMSVDADNTVEFLNNDIESKQETTILSGTAGIFLDLWPVGTLVPYVGAGAGIARIEANIKDVVDSQGDEDFGDSTQTVLTAFAEAGLPFNLTPSLAIVPSARFSWYNTKDKKDNDVGVADINEAEIASVGKGLYETQFLLSARYNF